jgi:hypothetical protein
MFKRSKYASWCYRIASAKALVSGASGILLLRTAVRILKDIY